MNTSIRVTHLRPMIRFGLRTLLIVPVLVGAWLALQVRVVHHRRAMKEFVIKHSGTIVEGNDLGMRQFIRGQYVLHPDMPRKSMEVSWVRRLMGDHAAVEVTVPYSLDEASKQRVEAAFPEAYFEEIIE